jgi:broad specificity phosphatase PhoE
MAAVPRVLLVRHGRAAASFGEDRDPPLSQIGQAQAEAMAASLSPLGPLTVVTSPLRRTRETAAPLERRFGVEARVEPAVAEVPSPSGTRPEPGPSTASSTVPPGGAAGPTSLAWRGPWLSDLLARRWEEVDPFVVEWRDGVLAALAALDTDTVVVTHFVAINVAVGRATGDPRVACCQPDYCSRTAVAIEDDDWSLLELGTQAPSAVG